MKKLDEILLFKSLAFKYRTHRGMDLEDLLSMQISEEQKVKLIEQSQTKNVCVHLPISFVEELEGVLAQLSMSKREFVHLAISDALNRFYEISKQHDIYSFCSPSEEAQS
jgi:hypothetical protein